MPGRPRDARRRRLSVLARKQSRRSCVVKRFLHASPEAWVPRGLRNRSEQRRRSLPSGAFARISIGRACLENNRGLTAGFGKCPRFVTAPRNILPSAVIESLTFRTQSGSGLPREIMATSRASSWKRLYSAHALKISRSPEGAPWFFYEARLPSSRFIAAHPEATSDVAKRYALEMLRARVRKNPDRPRARLQLLGGTRLLCNYPRASGGQLRTLRKYPEAPRAGGEKR